MLNQKEVTVYYVPKKPKREFSKMWLVACLSISLVFTSLSYILSFFDKNPVENLSIEIIKILWSVDGISFVGYTVQNFMRAYSKNKFVDRKEESYNEQQ